MNNALICRKHKNRLKLEFIKTIITIIKTIIKTMSLDVRILLYKVTGKLARMLLVIHGFILFPEIS